MSTQGMGVLMVGRTEAAASAATLAVQKALPASCRSCFLAFKVSPHPIIACGRGPHNFALLLTRTLDATCALHVYSRSLFLHAHICLATADCLCHVTV